jgi:hypothetical protein
MKALHHNAFILKINYYLLGIRFEHGYSSYYHAIVQLLFSITQIKKLLL